MQRDGQTYRRMDGQKEIIKIVRPFRKDAKSLEKGRVWRV